MLNQAVQMAVDYPYPQSAKSFENQVNAVSVFNYISEISKIQSPTLGYVWSGRFAVFRIGNSCFI